VRGSGDPLLSHPLFSTAYGRRNEEHLFRQGASFSGRERNHLFLNVEGRQFEEISGISGLDDPGDSRSFAILDYDRDGWPDVAVVSANAPMLQLFRNRIGDAGLEEAPASRFIAFRFVGGNRTAQASSSFSNRDGYGAQIRVTLGDGRVLLREHRSGEGFAAQNSATLLVGLGRHEETGSVRVRWPSGREQTFDRLPAGKLVTFYEDPQHSAAGEACSVAPYRASPPGRSAAARPSRRFKLPPEETVKTAPRLTLYVTLSAGCSACKQALPRLRRLRSRFAPGDLEMVGLPAGQDSRAELQAYAAEHAPPYRLQMDVVPESRAAARELVAEALGTHSLPASILTAADGSVLQVVRGVPSVSEVLKVMDEVEAAERRATEP
jgi:hypothetical protein